MVYYFLEGGAFMWPILMTLIFGLAFVIERAYSLMMSGVDSQIFFEEITSSVKEKGIEATIKLSESPTARLLSLEVEKMECQLY